MRYLAAYLLSTLSGNKEPTVDELSAILGSVGIEVDQERAKKVVSELKGKDINQLISEGNKKLASVPCGDGGGGGGGGGGGVTQATAAASAAAAGGDSSPAKGKAEAKKEEKKEESESEEDMGFGLFD